MTNTKSKTGYRALKWVSEGVTSSASASSALGASKAAGGERQSLGASASSWLDSTPSRVGYELPCITSLFDMLKIQASAFSQLLIGLKMFEETLKDRGLDDAVPTERIWEILRDRISEVGKTLEVMDLPVCLHKVAKVKSYIEGKEKIPAISRAFTVLVETIPEELSGRIFLYLTPTEKQLFENMFPFGREVTVAFPSAIFDLVESSKCLALGRGTASVYHLMGALEPCLKAMAAALQVQIKDPNWGPVIDDLQKKVETLPGTQDPKSDRSFYSDALANLSLIKTAWRNHCNHARAKYTEEEATQIYGAIKSFMRNLSQRVHE